MSEKSNFMAEFVHEARRKYVELIKKIVLPEINDLADADRWVAQEIGGDITSELSPDALVESLALEYSKFQGFLSSKIGSLPEADRLAIDTKLSDLWTLVENSIANRCLVLPEEPEVAETAETTSEETSETSSEETPAE